MLAKYFRWALVLVFICAMDISAMEYQHSLKLKNMNVSWRLDKDKVHFYLSAKTTGWVALGVGPEKVMQGANIIIGAVKKGKVRIQDHYADKKRSHKSDGKLGGDSHIINPYGREKDGVTVISFTLPLDTGEKWDKALKKKGMNRMMFAYGTGRDSFLAGHKFRTLYDVDLSTGKFRKIK